MMRKFVIAFSTVGIVCLNGLSAVNTDLSAKPLPFGATTTTTVVLRSKPDAKAAKVKCEYTDMDHGVTNSRATTLPKNFRLQATERSAEKAKVGKLSNYWYKIVAKGPEDGASSHCDVNGEPVSAWVFGAFLTE